MTFQLPSGSQKKEAGLAAAAYHAALFEPQGESALAYLTARGLTTHTIKQFQLGVVHEPFTGHGHVRGWISIPYLRPSGVISIRFRRFPDGEGAKYMQGKGSSIYLFNTNALFNAGHHLFTAEGEFDCMIAAQCGLPTVGIAGALNWKPHFRSVLDGFSSITVLTDNDDQGAGETLAEKIAEDMDNHGVRVLKMPDGHDVNSAFLEHGAGWLREYAGLDT